MKEMVWNVAHFVGVIFWIQDARHTPPAKTDKIGDYGIISFI
jgi:hypothetical protein